MTANLNSHHHLFFVEEVKEVNYCDNKMFMVVGSDYRRPTDFNRTKYDKHNFETCESCRNSYLKFVSKIENQFANFPNCCKHHKNLSKKKWFKLEHFKDFPRIYVDKLFYSWHHIINFIETDVWREEIFDFLEHIFESLGSFPENYGEPLYFKQFKEQLQWRVKKLKCSPSQKKEILEYIGDYGNPKTNKKTDWNVLMNVYNDWFKTFPFELSFFAHLRDHFSKSIPFFESPHTNKYSGQTNVMLRSKGSLINFLVETTKNIISEINTLTLYEKGLISDMQKAKLELIVQKRRQKLKDGYSNEVKDPDTRYRRILKEWLKDELEFLKELEPILKANLEVEANIYRNMLIACSKLQDNKIFWTADEDQRTRQVLDLLSLVYQTKDQPSYGKSESGKKAGSVDGVIVESDKKEYFVEAFNLAYLNKSIVQRHIHKLEDNYDAKGVLVKFLIIYCNVPDARFSTLFSDYSEFVESELPFKYVKIKSEKAETDYVNIKVLRTLHIRSDRQVALYHIFVKMPEG